MSRPRSVGWVAHGNSSKGGTAWETGLALALVGLHFGAYPITSHPISTDVRYFLYYAAQVAGGALPHVDFFENKTPLAFFLGGALYRMGMGSGLDPLWVIRAGYLALAGLAAVLAFKIHRRLGGDLLSGLLGMSPHFGFLLLGGLPCIGNVPKAIMALCASAAALAAARGKWWLAGLCGGLAALDWQVGAILVASAAAAALLSGPGRLRATMGVSGGVALVAAPFLALYGWRGALTALVDQTFWASLARGSGSMPAAGHATEWARRLQVVTSGTGGALWIVGVAAWGLAAFAFRVSREGTGPRRTILRVAGVYHVGVLCFSLLDFQGYGDLFIALHSVAFFAGVALVGFRLSLRRWLPNTPRIAAGGAVLLMLVVARPWVSRPKYRLVLNDPSGSVSLQDQRALALALQERLGDPTTVVLGPAELRFLSGTHNPGALVYWNRAAHATFRSTPQEPDLVTLRGLMEKAGARRVVCDQLDPKEVCARAFDGLVDQPVVGAYRVKVFAFRPSRSLRDIGGSASRPGAGS